MNLLEVLGQMLDDWKEFDTNLRAQNVLPG